MSSHVSSRSHLAEARHISAGLPDLLVEAHRVAATVLAGWHGRRTSGRGETFWQFRPFATGEAAASIDWRRSARDDHLYVREKEWEASHTVWLWQDFSRSMDFRSRLAPVTKSHRATILILALAEMLAAAGERIGLLGTADPVLARAAAERIAERIPQAALRRGFPPTTSLRQFSDLVLIGDFLDPLEQTEKFLTAVSKSGARAHIIQVTDPIEETFPFGGRTEFHDPETGTRHVVSRAEQYRDEYRAELDAVRAGIDDICRRLDWSFLIHRTDRPATEPLSAIHAKLADRRASAGLQMPRRAS
jgi:uncharacterized protein (DUF58 family)